ncbi:MAG: LPS export ABC transporter periplasmic protein LptC, partial [Prochlorococcus sp.]|nr:LPS export ABC transporter periplasmic protein LptC [Prochlorococcus sp.]
MVGCQTTDNIQIEEPIPFVFRSLNLRHKRVNGDRDWDLTSPEAKYESSRRIVRARLPEGILYKDSNPSFEISALNATIFNDGETVLLEGEVKLQQLGGQKVLIIGDRLRWTPDKSLMVIDQRPQALNSDSRLVAKRAEFQQQTHDLLLIGPTQLERWEEIRTPKQKPITIIRGRDGVWNLDSGRLVTNGPIMGTREPKGEDSIQTITSSELRGNTKAGYIDLIKPVRVNLPSENGNLQAKTTRWDFKREELESNKPFTGQLEQSSYSGDA